MTIVGEKSPTFYLHIINFNFNITIMKVTNTERMTQLGSSIKILASVMHDKLDESVLDTKISKVNNTTVSDALNYIIAMCDTICGQGREAKYYYADIDLPYTEDTFPVEHR